MIQDEKLGKSYEVAIPCGRTREEAVRRFQELQKEQSQGLWTNYSVRLQRAFPSYFLQPLESLPSSSWKLGDFSCSQQEPANPLEKAGKMRVRLDLEGDPALGEILFVRQAHFLPSLITEKFLKSGLADRILDYQWGISEALVGLKPQHVFVEGLTQDLDSTNLDFKAKEFISKAPVLWMMPGLLDLGLRQKITFHKTLTPEEGDFFDNYAKSASSDDPLYEEIVMKRREGWGTREIAEFLRKNPGEKIVLIYGAAHNFCDDFVRMGYRPRIYSVWFEKEDNPMTKLIAQNLPPACP